MFRSEHHISRPEQSVRSSGENGKFRHSVFVQAKSVFLLLVLGELHSLESKPDLGAEAFPDPLALLLFGLFRPFDRVQIFQQTLGIVRDPEHPLAHRLAMARMPASLGTAVVDFLVGQYRAQFGTPPDGNLVEISQTLGVDVVVLFLLTEPLGHRKLADGTPFALVMIVPGIEKQLEDPLSPAIVVGVGGADLAVPIVGKAERFDLPLKSLNVLLRCYRRMSSGGHGILLGGQTESVPSHGVEHIEAGHPAPSGQDIGGRITFRMTDVQSGSAGIRKHIQHVILGLIGVEIRVTRTGCPESVVLLPVLLPFRLDRSGIVTVIHALSFLGPCGPYRCERAEVIGAVPESAFLLPAAAKTLGSALPTRRSLF